MVSSVGFLQVAASALLVVLALVISWWLRLHLERRLIVAALRAAVQLVAVGLIFRVVFESDRAMALSVVWVLVMLGVGATVVHNRAGALPRVGMWAVLAMGLATAIADAVVFGLGVLPTDPVTLVVTSGITIGNTVPAAALAANRLVGALTENRGQIEALLALGFDAGGTVRQTLPELVGGALIPQIERTRGVGLIALPGAMTGLLLAGTAPLDAVLIQLIVMYLILGSVAVTVVVVTAAGLASALRPELRVPDLASTAT